MWKMYQASKHYIFPVFLSRGNFYTEVEEPAIRVLGSQGSWNLHGGVQYRRKLYRKRAPDTAQRMSVIFG